MWLFLFGKNSLLKIFGGVDFFKAGLGKKGVRNTEPLDKAGLENLENICSNIILRFFL